MAVIRRNIVNSQAARDAFVAGVLALKAEFLGTTTVDLGLSGPPQDVSTYDLFTVWHHLAMGLLTPADAERPQRGAQRPGFRAMASADVAAVRAADATRARR